MPTDGDWRNTPCLGTGQRTSRPNGYHVCPVCKRKVASRGGRIGAHKDQRGTAPPA